MADKKAEESLPVEIFLKEPFKKYKMRRVTPRYTRCIGLRAKSLMKSIVKLISPEISFWWHLPSLSGTL